MSNLLIQANELLRSAYEIADREGRNTNWVAFKASLLEVLHAQSIVIVGHAVIDASATCTARTYRLPIEQGEDTPEQTP